MNNLVIELDKEFTLLPNAPIVEAVVHWQTTPQSELQEAALLKELSKTFGDYSIQPHLNQEVGFSGNAENFEVKQRMNWEGFRLSAPKDLKPKFVCQFLKNGVVFSQLAPYQGWAEFIEEAKRFWAKFIELANPSSVSPLSLRYISQIPVQSSEDIGNCIEQVCAPLSDLGLEADHFFHQDSIQLRNHPYKINVIRAVQPATEKSANLIVDISVSTTSVMEDFNILDDRLNELRFIKNEVFFALMKDAESKFGAT